jgi:hypothetical protein
VGGLADLDRRARRHVGLIAFAAVAVAFAASAVHLARFDRVAAATSVAVEDRAGGGVASDATAVGPRIGEALEPYLAARRDALASIPDGEVVRAVVSFVRPFPAEEVALPPRLAVEAVQLRVPVVDVAPVQRAVSDEGLVAAVTAAIEDEREVLAEELRDLRTTLASDVADDAFRADFERRLEELADLDEVLVANAPVVFAVVVTASGAELRALAAEPDVRLVDPGGPPGTDPARRFFGLLPDDTVRATHGRPL